MLLASAAIVLIFPLNDSFKYDIQKGAFWEYDTLISPFDIVVKKTDKELQQEKEAIIENKKLYFDVLPSFEEGYTFPKELEGLPQDYTVVLIDDSTPYDIDIEDIRVPIKFNEEKTNAKLNIQLSNISDVKAKISKGDEIIEKGQEIDKEKYDILSVYKQEYESRLDKNKIIHKQHLGQFLLIAITLIAMLMFFKYIMPQIYFDNKKILLILFVLILMVAITSLIVNFQPQYLYVAPICLTPIIIKTFFDSRCALYVFIINVIIIGFSMTNSFEFCFCQLIVGLLVIISMEQLEKRSDFFKTSLYIFIAYSITYIALTLVQDATILNVNKYRFIYFAINATMTLLAIPLIYVIEKIFGYVSELSLLEYSNTNTKLLRELSKQAPGTFQHCIQVANIAEDLIHQIGGKALLVKAGALHHDIGKMIRPLFFIENQSTNFNPHDDISCEESAQIITSHVIDGVKIANKYKLPDQIIDFIRTHHGTTITKYFYNKQKQEHPNMPIDNNIFTYKGPKPFSKETAVVMMVDSVEAASRSLKNHTEKDINELVDNIIDGQIAANQFTNSDITFKDITIIKQFLKLKLQAIYHTRIQYPISK
jgi:putative nucleotidyltransferase with HDIG domain